jgi:phosphatidylglycerol:prolipoprotein diacylglycerol transferase
MLALAIPFPEFDPVLIEIGPFAIHWYALAYVAGLVFAWLYMKRLMATERLWKGPAPATPIQVDDLLFWCALGVILGGRLGYVLAYNAEHYLANPIGILALWQGGMSFHGGFLGVVLAVFFYCRLKRLSFWSIIDAAAAGVPVGLLLGRIANFINGELYGRETDLPWAVEFPAGGWVARHPSQLYEALLEGLLLFVVLRVCTHRLGCLKRPGLVSGIFAAGYGTARLVVEFVREPDRQIGFLAGGITMGMVLSVPMIALGIWLIWRARGRPAAA